MQPEIQSKRGPAGDSFLSSDTKRSFLRPTGGVYSRDPALWAWTQHVSHFPFSFSHVLYLALSFPPDPPIASVMALVGTQGQPWSGWYGGNEL